MDMIPCVMTHLSTPTTHRQRRAAPVAVLWLACLLLAWDAPRLQAAAAQLTLSGTVEWRGQSSWSDTIQSYSDSITISAQYRAVFPMNVDEEGHYYLIQENKMETSSVTVSGGGSDEFQILGAMKWTYQAADNDQDILGCVNLFHDDGRLQVDFQFPSTIVEGVDMSGDPLPSGFRGWAFDGCKSAWDAWWAERDGVARFPSNAVSFSASGQGAVSSRMETQGIVFYTGSMSANFSVSTSEPRFEAVIIPPSDYDEWKPEGGVDEDTPGNSMVVRVEIRAKKQEDVPAGRGKFIFDLEDTSTEPGLCLNKPAKDAAKYTHDLKIDKTLDPKLEVDENGQHAETTEESAYYDLVINSHDFGGFGRLKASVKVQGESILAELESDRSKTRLAVPKDDNENNVADGWEREKQVYSENLSAYSDGVINPIYGGQAADGDGISFYERYRGLVVSADGSLFMHERLDPRFKHLFIRNPDGLVSATFGSADGAPESYGIASSCLVRYVDDKGWTGWGSFAAGKRIVNFNYSEDKHAIDQHALYVVLDPARNPAEPAEWIALVHSMGRTNRTAASIDAGCEGATYPDQTGPSAFAAHWRPAYTYEVVIYGGNVNDYVTRCVEYHSAADLAGRTAAQQSQIILDYMRDHRDDARTKRTIEMSATLAHELGHGTGINHHNPDNDTHTDPDLAHCTMRYYGPDEFAVDPSDRFELAARGHQPSQFCRKKHNCWGQLAINDNPSAPASPGAAPAPALAAGLYPPFQRATRQADAPAPTLSISADLAWPEVVEGDALRLWGRLHGPTASVASNWVEGFQFTLWQVDEDGGRQAILEPDDFKAFLQPLTFDPADLGLPNPTLIREWLVTPEAAQLAPGRYAIAVAWNSASGGLIEGPEILFEVMPADTDAAEALRHRHLAWLAQARGDAAAVLEHAREASRLDPDTIDPLAIQTTFLMSTAALRQGDPMSAALAMNAVKTGLLNPGSHLAGIARDRFELLAPTVKAHKPPPGAAKTRLEINGLPGHTYVLERSPDLVHWTPMGTNTLQSAAWTIEDDNPSPGSPRFYRVQWVQ